jgi:hypothetical protein
MQEHYKVSIYVTSDEQLRAVYAVLAAGAAVGSLQVRPSPAMPQTSINEQRSAVVAQLDAAGRVNAEEPDEEPELDSDGLPFDPATMTGTKLKSGQWRMKSGVERPNSANTAAAGENTTTSAPETLADSGASPSDDEDDEFAAFRNAAAASDAAPAAEVPARTWTDADLSALTNQAASKMGAERVPQLKAIIAEYCPDDTVAHSRHVPADKREALAQAVEAWADIEFAG